MDHTGQVAAVWEADIAIPAALSHHRCLYRVVGKLKVSDHGVYIAVKHARSTEPNEVRRQPEEYRRS